MLQCCNAAMQDATSNFKLITSLMSHKNQILTSLIILAWLAGALVVSDYFVWPIPETLRIAFGSLSLLFIPWYRVTKALFRDETLDILEIIALSFAFSISVVPLLVFYLNLAWLPIGQRLVYGVCALVTIGWIIWHHWRWRVWTVKVDSTTQYHNNPSGD